MKNTLHFNFLRTLMIFAFGLFFNAAWGQIVLPAGNIYTQNFNNLPTMPQGWSVRTGSSATAIGTVGALAASDVTSNSWASTSGNFRNVASAKSPLVEDSSNALQYNSGDRALAIRPSGSYGDPGGSFVLQIQNSVGKKDFNLQLKHMIFDAQSRITVYTVEYSKQANGNGNWVSLGSFSTNLDWGATDATYSFGDALDNYNSTVWIRVRGNASTSTGSRDTYGIDDFVLTWSDVVASTTTTWNGTAWSNGAPTASLDAIIAGNYNTTTNGVFTAKTLTVNSGDLTVATGTSITVENAIVNNAGVANFIVQSGANIIQNTNAINTGAITVLRNSAPIVRLDHTLWSSPVANQNLFGFSPNTLTNRFYTYQTAINKFVTTGLSSSSEFAPANGYGIRAANNYQTSPAVAWEGSFKGIPNNGNYSVALATSGTGFNLVGNPYPSAINASVFTSVANNPAIDGTLYFYVHSLAMDANGNFPVGSNYTTWNSTGHTFATNSSIIPNGIIQVGQGFLVKATQAANLNFNNLMRSSDVANQFFRSSNAFAATTELEKHRIWLNLTNPEGTTFNQLLVGYVAGATEGVDRGFDGLSFGNEGSFIATSIDGSEYAIQARALPFQDSDVVPMVFKAASSGDFTISLSAMDGLFSQNQDVYLKDVQSGTLHNLKLSNYNFTSPAGTFANKFQIVFRSALATPDTAFTANSIVAFKRANVLNVETKNFEMTSVKAFDVQGRLVYTKSNINANQIQLSDLQVQNGVLLLQVTSTEGQTATIKVIY